MKGPTGSRFGSLNVTVGCAELPGNMRSKRILAARVPGEGQGRKEADVLCEEEFSFLFYLFFFTCASALQRSFSTSTTAADLAQYFNNDL